MLSNEFLHKLSSKAAGIFPAATSIQKELEGKLFELLQGSFAKLNLVTREEFDSQLEVLARAQQNILALEEKIAALEQQNAKATVPTTPDEPSNPH